MKAEHWAGLAIAALILGAAFAYEVGLFTELAKWREFRQQRKMRRAAHARAVRRAERGANGGVHRSDYSRTGQ